MRNLDTQGEGVARVGAALIAGVGQVHPHHLPQLVVHGAVVGPHHQAGLDKMVIIVIADHGKL